MADSWLSGRLAALANLGLSLLLPPGLPWSILPLPLYTAGMALAMASLTLAALDLFPARRGLAASCQSFIQSSMNVITAAIAAPLLWASTRSLAGGMLGLMLLGLLCFAGYRRAMQRQAWLADSTL